MTQQAKGHEFNENDIFENNKNDYYFFINSSPWSFKLQFFKAIFFMRKCKPGSEHVSEPQNDSGANSFSHLNLKS